MTELETLYQVAYDEDIFVLDTHFSATKKSACLCGLADNIVLDRSSVASNAEEAELLSHELVHIK